jgi:hypothetical protein
MNLRHHMHFLLPMLALSLTLGMVAPTQAKAGDVSLQVRFGTAPHWEAVPGTQVRYIRQGDRTDYDVFRYGRRYYAYNNANGRWYMSRRDRGRYVMIDDSAVPRDLRRVPRNNWRNYPTSWEDRNGQGRGGNWDHRNGRGTNGRLRVTFGTTPHWTGVRGTRVQWVPVGERPGYDVFRYDNTYYAYDNNHWYSSSSESGDFIMIDERSVPTEMRRVPRDQWNEYPTSWEDRNGQWDNRNGQGTSGRLRVTFGTAPHWYGVRGTRVETVPAGERPNYDLFRYDNTYYAYDNNRWYSSSNESGDFIMIDERSVPTEMRRVPRDQWREYPTSWQGR